MKKTMSFYPYEIATQARNDTKKTPSARYDTGAILMLPFAPRYDTQKCYPFAMTLKSVETHL
jgi:hypothetical protein